MQVTGIGVRSGRAILLLGSLVFGALIAPRVSAQDRLQGQPSGAPATATNASEPVLVVSIASLNKLMQDVNYVTAAAGQPAAGGFFTMVAGGFSQGIDLARPIAIMVSLVDGAPEPVAMIPAPDAESMLKRLEAQGQIGAIDRLDDGTMVAAAGPSLIYIRQAGQWAVVARQKEALDLAPQDPMTLLEDLGNNYTFGARLNVQQIPTEVREGLIAQMRQGFEQAMAQQSGDAAEIQAASEGSIKQLEQVIRESEELMFGININPDEKLIAIDTEFTAAAGTEMAEMYSGQKVIASQFANVINDENSMFYHAATSLSPKVIERTRESIAGAKQMAKTAIEDIKELDDSEKTQVTEMLMTLIDMTMQTLEEGKADIGMQAVADDGEVQVAAGMFVADGAKAAQLVKDVAAKLKDVNEAPTFSFDEEEYKGVTLHAMKVQIPADKAELRELFGEQVTVKIGTAPKAVYFGVAEEDSAAVIKQFIDARTTNDNPADRPLGQLQVQLLPFLRLAQSIKAQDVVAAMIDTLAQNGETDYVAVESQPIDNGQASYVEIGEGVVKAIGAAIREGQLQQMRQQQGAGQF